MISDYYLQTYLYDIVGMTPKAAAAYLKASPASHWFRSMRIVHDVVRFDPDIHRSNTDFHTGRVSPVFEPEEMEQGRVTVSVALRNGFQCIRDAFLEHGHRRLKPAPWPPRPAPVVFAVTEPEFVGRMPVRRDIEVLPPEPERRRFRTFAWGNGEAAEPEPARPQRGWFIQQIESLHIVDPGPRASRAPAPPQKPYVPLYFEEVPW